MTELYFENVRTKKRFKVVAMDKANGTIKLRGELAEFEEPYDKERFEKLGYRLVKGEPDGESSRSQA